MPDAERSRDARGTQFALPDLGEGLTEATIVEWLVRPGDTIAVDQPVVEVETAKARVEVPAPFAGVVSHLLADVGDTVPVGFALLTIEEQAAGFDEPGAVRAPADESGRVLVGYGTSTPARRHRRSRATAPAGNHPVISPLVRRLAREHGIDVAHLAGSGPHGTVLRRDVEAALTDRATSGRVGQPEVARSGETRAGEPRAGERRVPLTGIRKSAAELFTRSRREIPEATVWVDVDATALLEARAALNAARPDEPVSLVALVARFSSR